MSLSHHVSDAGSKSGDKKSKPHHVVKNLARYSDINSDIPRYSLPEGSMTAIAAADFIRSELRLDGNPNLNLASFVTTQVDRECHDLITESLNKNMPDQDQYPHSNDIQDRCISMLADLWNAPSTSNTPATNPDGKEVSSGSSKSGGANPNTTTGSEEGQHAVGTATIGSSEAILLAGLALKWRWRERQAKKRNCKPADVLERPNIIFSAAVHVSILKLCRFFDIDARVLPVERNRLVIDCDEVVRQCDDKTAGVFLILGTTLTGELEDIKGMNDRLLKLKSDKGLDIPIHVDGASGAMVVPFVWPDHEWDFRLEQVRSINTSGHKYGLTYPGLGWVVWKTKEDLPEGLIFHVNYLGIDEPTFSLNFSKSASTVIGQYYNFLRLGRAGYTQIMESCITNAKHLAKRLSSLGGVFDIVSKHDEPSLPLVAFKFASDEAMGFDATILVHELRGKGWIVPAYTLPANASDVLIMRVVVRETFTHEMVEMLVEDVRLILIALTHKHGKEDVKQRLIEAALHESGGSSNRRNKHHVQQVKAVVAGEQAGNNKGVATMRPQEDSEHANRDADKLHEMTGGKSDLSTNAGADGGKGAKAQPTVHTIC